MQGKLPRAEHRLCLGLQDPVWSHSERQAAVQSEVSQLSPGEAGRSNGPLSTTAGWSHPTPLSLDGLCYSLAFIRHRKAEELGDQSLVAMRFLLFWPLKSRQGSGFCCSTCFLSEHIHTPQRPEGCSQHFFGVCMCSVSWAYMWRSGIPLHDCFIPLRWGLSLNLVFTVYPSTHPSTHPSIHSSPTHLPTHLL